MRFQPCKHYYYFLQPANNLIGDSSKHMNANQGRRKINSKLATISLITFALIGIEQIEINSGWHKAFAQDTSSSKFSVYCDPNGLGTGECYRFDNSEKVSCEYASQDFIQCQPKNSPPVICVYFAPWQFSCQSFSQGNPLSDQNKCDLPLDASGRCLNPLRDRTKDRLIEKPTSDIRSDEFGNTALPDTLKDTLK